MNLIAFLLLYFFLFEDLNVFLIINIIFFNQRKKNEAKNNFCNFFLISDSFCKLLFVKFTNLYILLHYIIAAHQNFNAKILLINARFLISQNIDYINIIEYF